MKVELKKTEAGFAVVAPYSDAWRDAARRAGGCWNAELKAWGFVEGQRAEVEVMLADIFGYGLNEAFMKVRVLESYFQSRDSVRVYKLGEVEVLRHFCKRGKKGNWQGVFPADGVSTLAGGWEFSDADGRVNVEPGTILLVKLPANAKTNELFEVLGQAERADIDSVVEDVVAKARRAYSRLLNVLRHDLTHGWLSGEASKAVAEARGLLDYNLPAVFVDAFRSVSYSRPCAALPAILEFSEADMDALRASFEVAA